MEAEARLLSLTQMWSRTKLISEKQYQRAQQEGISQFPSHFCLHLHCDLGLVSAWTGLAGKLIKFYFKCIGKITLPHSGDFLKEFKIGLNCVSFNSLCNIMWFV